VVLKSRADRSAYNAAIFPLAAQRTRVTAALTAPGLPAGVTSAYGAAFGQMSSKVTARDWVGALAAVPAYKRALADADKALYDGKKFYTVYASIRPEDIQAQGLLRSTDNNFQNNAKLSAAGSQFAHYREILEKAIAEPDWGDAKDVLADLQVAAREFIAEAARHQRHARRTTPRSRRCATSSGPTGRWTRRRRRSRSPPRPTSSARSSTPRPTRATSPAPSPPCRSCRRRSTR
jgi:hypothetical protein